MPSSRPSVSDRQDATHGNTPLRYLSPAALASFLVTPIQATSGSVYATDGITFPPNQRSDLVFDLLITVVWGLVHRWDVFR
jgi:hypothetical protein